MPLFFNFYQLLEKVHEYYTCVRMFTGRGTRIVYSLCAMMGKGQRSSKGSSRRQTEIYKPIIPIRLDTATLYTGGCVQPRFASSTRIASRPQLVHDRKIGPQLADIRILPGPARIVVVLITCIDRDDTGVEC